MVLLWSDFLYEIVTLVSNRAGGILTDGHLALREMIGSLSEHISALESHLYVASGGHKNESPRSEVASAISYLHYRTDKRTRYRRRPISFSLPS